MKALLIGAAVIAIAACATSSSAADRIYDHREGDLILTGFTGKTYWEVQAMCAGFHRATASWWTEKGRQDRARSEQIASAQATNRVVLQLRRDRGLADRNEAIRLAAASEQVGWRLTRTALEKDGVDVDGEWNFWRSFCVRADQAFFRLED